MTRPAVQLVHRSCALAAAVLVAGVFAATSTVHTQPSPSMPADARAQIAPGGRLRAALNYSNFLLVSKRTPEHAGVAPDLARELARRAGATVEFVGYENAGLVADAVRDNAWDVAFIGAEPARADLISFTPAYVEIEATYLVKGDTPFRAPGHMQNAVPPESDAGRIQGIAPQRSTPIVRPRPWRDR